MNFKLWSIVGGLILSFLAYLGLANEPVRSDEKTYTFIDIERLEVRNDTAPLTLVCIDK